MSAIRKAAAENGWPLTLLRAAASVLYRVRDALVARRLGTSDFHCGHAPRLLGLVHMTIGEGFRANDHLWLHAIVADDHGRHMPRLSIGPRFTASDSVHVAAIGEVSIGADVLVGSRVIISDHGHGVYRGAAQSGPETAPVRRPLSSTGGIRIGNNVWIGDGVAVLAGSDIGDGAVIGANSVVTSVVPAGTIALGTPARPVRQWNAANSTWDRIA